MTTPRWLIRARRRRDEILENDAAIKQIQEDRSDRASFEGNFVERLKLDALEKERARLSWRLTQALARGAGLDPYAVDEVCRQRLIYGAYGAAGLTAVSGGGDGGATPETPVAPSDPDDMTVPETPLEPSMPEIDPSTLTSYFVAVDAPSDTGTPEDDVASLFTPAAFQAGVSFTGRDVEPPGNYDVRKVEGLAIHPDLPFTHIIAAPNALRQDVTSFYVRKSDVEIGGQTYRRYLAVRPGNWQNPTPDFLPTFNLHFRLEDN